MTAIRALIVDDEPLAREKIRTLLKRDPDIEVTAELRNGVEAVAAIRRDSPDLIFLDVQMPELDGFGVLEQIGPEGMPAVIFVTAYDEYALRAFEVHALDYLLKPFDRERFETALRRAKQQVREQESNVSERILALLAELQTQQRRGQLERLVVKSGGRVYFVPVEDIDWIEAAGNYVELHAGQQSHLIRGTMKGLEDRLDPECFVRVHRSAIVNINRIKEMQPWFNGEFVIILTSGAKITSGNSYREGLRRLLENPA
jgi:two-component system LytT family response regulator